MDSLGDLLAILFGIADAAQAGRILDYIHDCGLDRPYPMRAVYPVIHLGERDWGFNEWFHRVSGEPMGFDGQSWSAALYIFAHDAVRRGSVNVFSRDNGRGIRVA